MNGTELGDLELRAKRGDGEAQIALARHFEAQKNSQAARGWFAQAAKLGSVAALRSLAINLLSKDPIVHGDGVNMIRAAADQGDAEAAYVCAMLAAQDGRLDGRWKVAREALERAAERGWPLARKQLEFLGADFSPANTGSQSVVREIFGSPRVGIIENFATAATCDWLIERAGPLLERAPVYDSATGGFRIEDARSNRSASFDVAHSDMVVMLLRDRIAALADLPLMGMDYTAVLHYAPGQEFVPHFDFLDADVPAYAREIATKGQRAATFLIYLNDDYEGGETEFPKLDWRYKGRKGDAILFWNLTPEGAPEERMLHAGLPPTKGEKWLLSQWLRQRAH
jgi:prolyl 4-hydroxylase